MLNGGPRRSCDRTRQDYRAPGGYSDRVTERISITYDVRRAPREQLVAELEEFAAHRAEQGKQERADGARAAAAKLLEGQDRVQFEHTAYIVDDEPSRDGVRRGSREWALAEARESEAGWTHEGNRLLALASHQAVAELERGATRVRIGHIVYEVAEAS